MKTGWRDRGRLEWIFLRILLVAVLVLLAHCVLELHLGAPNQPMLIGAPRANSMTIGSRLRERNTSRHVTLSSSERPSAYRRRGLHDLTHRRLRARTVNSSYVGGNASPVARKRPRPSETRPSTTRRPPTRDVDAPADASYFRFRDYQVSDIAFNFSLMPRDVCARGADSFLVMLVCSKHENFPHRRAIRDTWGSIRQYQKRIKLVFLIGQHADQYWNRNIHKEARTFNDILHMNVRESYQNLTLKVLSGMEWAVRYCNRTRYILKSDEDMIINVPFLMEVLVGTPMANAIRGSVNTNAPVMRSSKWGVPYHVYPYTTYPPYMSGNSYVVSMDAVRKLVRGFRFVPMVNIEDAYITGILARITGVAHRVDDRFTYWGSPIINACDIVNNKMITGTHMTPKLLYSMWKAINKRNC